MKKFIAIIAAIAMIASMTVCAFAGETTKNITGDVSKDVAAVYDVGTEKTQEIHLTVAWTDTSFTFKVSGENWDETAMEWKDNVDGTWVDDEAKVDFTSKSSCPITITATYTAEDVAVKEAVKTVELAAADKAVVEGSVAFEPADNATITKNVTAGSIAITVAEKAELV